MNRYISCLIALSLGTATVAGQNPVINEVMQSNVDALFVDHEFPDSWVELYNPSSNQPIALKGWKLGLSNDFNSAWQFPESALIEPNGYLVVYCDKTQGGLHTPFRIDSGKGSVYLFNARGKVVEQLDLKKQVEPNIAFGRLTDGSDKWGYMTVASPAATNSGIISSSELAPEPTFSISGFVGVAGKDNVNLTVSLPDDAGKDANLCVTTDGREPQLNDAVQGNVWSAEISATTVVRAKIIAPELLPRRATTHSYIFHPRETQLRVVSLVSDSTYFYSDDEGIMMGEFENNPNWENDWRRPVNIEIFDGSGTEASVNQLGETRIQGGWSRREPQKSMAVYSNKRFGTKRFYTALWDDKPNVTEPKSFILRNGGNAFASSRINDAVAHTIIGTNSEHADWQAYSPAIYYINGKYMGITDIRERSNEDYVAANYDGLEDIDMLENHWDVKAGSHFAYFEFLDFVESSNFNVDRLKELLDIDNFLDMMAIKIFAHDTDFPYNNIVSWKPVAPGSKWRFIIKDVDRLGIWWMSDQIENDYYDHLYEVNSSDKRHYCYLLSRFYEHPELSPLLIDRLSVYLGDMLSVASAEQLIDKITAAIEPEYTDHLQVYYQDDYLERYEGEHGWLNTVDYLRNFWWPQRVEAVYNHLAQRYGLGKPVSLTIHRADVPTSFNNINLSQSSWRGKFYPGAPIHLSTPDDGYCWVVDTHNGDEVTEQRFHSNDAVFTIPADATKVRVHLEERFSSLETIDIDAIKVGAEGNCILVESPCNITLLEITDMLGRIVHRSAPNSTSACAEIDLPSSIALVKVQTASGQTKVVKLATL